MILPLALLFLAGPAQPSAAATNWLGRSAELALACVHKGYPNKIAHVLNGDTDVRAPHELTPAFYGCYDWHSSVHGHWLLARVARLHGDAPFAARARAALDESLTAANIAAEVRYLNGAGRVSFERPTGWRGFSNSMPSCTNGRPSGRPTGTFGGGRRRSSR